MQEVVYLDYNATSPMLPEIKRALLEHAGKPLNPSSIHASGRAARKIVEEARANILKAVNAKALVFCGSATEANNLVLQQADVIIASEIEHESIYKAAIGAKIIPVTKNGIVDLEALKSAVSKGALVSVMLANNETGIIQPIKEVAAITHAAGALVHTDAVQAYGRINIDFAELGVDFMTVAPHKSGGAVGSAALIFRADIELKNFIKGGGQEKNKRAGTENVLAIHAFGIHATIVSRGTVLNAVNEYLESELGKLGIEVVGKNQLRLGNTTNFIHPKFEASTQLIHFDSEGICLSSGSACSSGKVEVSRAIKAMGIEKAKNAIRVSTGWATTNEDAEALLRAILKLGNT